MVEPCRRGAMFEARKYKKALAAYRDAHDQWAAARGELAQVIAIGEAGGSSEPAGILLHKGERLVLELAGCALIEDRRGPGHYQGGSQGVSIPIGSLGGRSVRYRVGASRGHYVQGEPVATAIDTGSLFVSDQRAVFVGAKQTRECAFSKLVGIDTSIPGETVFSVTNRQKATVVSFGAGVSRAVDLRLKLALAMYQQNVPEVLSELRSLLAELDAHEPTAPAHPT